MQLKDGHILAHILAATSIGVISTTAFHYYHRQKPQKQLEDQTVVPLLDRNEPGRVAKLERFSNYVTRQIGFEVESECPQLCKLAYKYLKKSKECEITIYEYFADEPNVKLVEEFDRKVEQVAEEVDSLKESLDKYFLRNQRRTQEARERAELLERANGESSRVLRIFDDEAQAM
ncbi:Membrin-11 [Camellia lanceoleosa]|uniref:Membrin-11 n=1 Tax=Camellia lanceoleosa TaxID=1840588 RepID=A0ACC0I338_9ERIC|nr:Membrin-11 [Camellia lanceoleosa]